VRERLHKLLRASEIARRRAEDEGDEVFFLGDRGRSRRLPSAMRERLHKLPRASEIARRRTEDEDTRRSSSAIEDEEGGFQARCASGSINCRTHA